MALRLGSRSWLSRSLWIGAPSSQRLTTPAGPVGSSICAPVAVVPLASDREFLKPGSADADDSVTRRT